MVVWLAQTLLSCAKFRPLRVIIIIKYKNIKKYNFADTGLAVGTPAGFVPAKACFKRSRWFGKRHKTDALTKLGKLLSELHVPLKQCLTEISDTFSASFTSIWRSFPRFYCTPPPPPQKKRRVPTLCYTRRHLPSAVPWISEDRLFYVRASTLRCFRSLISTQTFRRALTASADSCAETKSAPSVAEPLLAEFGGRCRKVMLGVCPLRTVCEKLGSHIASKHGARSTSGRVPSRFERFWVYLCWRKHRERHKKRKTSPDTSELSVWL